MFGIKVVHYTKEEMEAKQKELQARTPTAVRTYTDPQVMSREIAEAYVAGYDMVGQSAATPRKGAGRTVAGGLLFFNRKPVTTVTFARSNRWVPPASQPEIANTAG